MSKVITRWSPDTCGCTIDYEWERESTEDERVHSFHASVIKCNHHNNLDKEDHFNTVMEENTRKNRVIGKARELVTSIQHYEIAWKFDEQRVLHISHPSLSGNVKKSLQDDSDSAHGKGKVVVG